MKKISKITFFARYCCNLVDFFASFLNLKNLILNWMKNYLSVIFELVVTLFTLSIFFFFTFNIKKFMILKRVEKVCDETEEMNQI